MRRGRIPTLSGAIVLAGAVALVVGTLVAGLGRPAWIAGAVLIPVAGALLAAGAWSASEARGDGNAALLTHSGAPLVVTIVACVVLLALPGWLLDRANDDLIAWRAGDVVLVDGDLALSVEPATGARAATVARPDGPFADPPPGVVVGRDPADGRERWRTALEPATDQRYDASDPDGWRRIGDVALVSGGGFGFAALDARTGRLLWQDPGIAPRVVLATTRSVATTRCDPLPAGADEDGPGTCTAEGRDLRTGRVVWSAPTRDEGRLLGAPSIPPARDDGPWPSRFAVVDAPAADAPAGGRAWEVRDVDSGRVLSRGRATRETTLTALAGGVLRGDPAGAPAGSERTRLRLLDPATGRARWVRTVEGRPVDAGVSQSSSVAVPGGWLVLQSRFRSLDAGLEPLSPTDSTVALLDPRDGRSVGARLPADVRRVGLVRTPTPLVTAATLASGPAPATSLVAAAPDEDRGLVLVPGARSAPAAWTGDVGDARRLALAGPLVAIQRPGASSDAIGERQEDTVELRDARTAAVVGRLRGDDLPDARAESDRIVVRRTTRTGAEDLVLVRRS